ncbi:MAG: type I glutamate--ammonia ligase [Armatimonadota bacterium]|nr:type I glutamate--ammonia ligase [Armatimonadota bacterium]MDR5696392.1 type I glutamate--ammonia ligase [Armatimonadota bacterium]
MASKTARDVLAEIKEKGIQMVDFRFTDLPGTWQHATIPVSAIDETTFRKGIGFDGSSIRGFKEIQESDMILLPDPDTARVDPFCTVPTMTMICDVLDPELRAPFSRDPRQVAKRAEEYLRETGIADVSYWGPEAEFFVFSDVRYENLPHRAGFAIDSPEGIWNTGNGERNLGYKIRTKEGYFPTPPSDTLMDLRSEMSMFLEQWGIPVEYHHHEVATAGQCEIDMRFATLLHMADNLMCYKYIVKNTARRHGLTATFMPKPLFGDNGSGMHTHQSLWKGDRNLFYAEGQYAELSETALYYIGGLLTHIDALLAFCAPTTNSYRRLVPHYEAPVNVAFSKRNRSAAIRVPMYETGPEGAAAKRVEFRPPDPTCNPYLAFAAMLMAGLDGVRRKIDPVAAGFGPLDKNTYELDPDEAARVRSVPGSLARALEALESDCEFLLEGDVFTRDLIETWIAYKREKELHEVNIRPHPYEFYLYFDV